jgi:endonuclease YncB( thermonuclease family)
LRVQLGSGPETVRLYGVDAPEARAPFGREATQALRALVAGGAVELQPVADDPYDKYDRLIAVVYVGGTNVNETLVADGVAWAYRRYLGQVDGDEAFCEIEASARAAQRGLWSQPAERWVPPWIYRRRQDALPGARVPSRDYSRESAADCKAAIGEGRRRR